MASSYSVEIRAIENGYLVIEHDPDSDSPDTFLYDKYLEKAKARAKALIDEWDLQP